MKTVINTIKLFFLWLKTSQEETPNVASSMRMIMTIGVLSILAVWVWSSIKDGHMSKIDPTVLGLVALLVGGKSTQHFSE